MKPQEIERGYVYLYLVGRTDCTILELTVLRNAEREYRLLVATERGTLP